MFVLRPVLLAFALLLAGCGGNKPAAVPSEATVPTPAIVAPPLSPEQKAVIAEIEAFRATQPVYREFLATYRDEVVPLLIEATKSHALIVATRERLGVENFTELARQTPYEPQAALQPLYAKAASVLAPVSEKAQALLDSGSIALSEEEKAAFLQVREFLKAGVRTEPPGPDGPYAADSIAAYEFRRETGTILQQFCYVLAMALLKLPDELQQRKDAVLADPNPGDARWKLSEIRDPYWRALLIEDERVHRVQETWKPTEAALKKLTKEN